MRPGFLDAERCKQLHQSIPCDSPVETMDYVEKRVMSGDYTIASVFEDGTPVGWTVYGIENHEQGREMLSVASYGQGKGNLTRAIIPKLEGVARGEGCKTIRLHTIRPGLVEQLLKQGWFVSEIVMRKELQ
jgi:hypothetical protein